MNQEEESPLLYLPTLAAIADSGSFSRAADVLGLNRAAVSKRVGRLEKSLGVPVLLRTTRHVELTPSGLALLARHREAETLLHLGVDEARGLMSKLGGRVEVRCNNSSLAVHVVGPALLAFSEENPGIRVNINSESSQPGQVSADIELRLTNAPPADRSAKVLARVSWSLQASQSYLKQHGIPRTPHDLLQHRMITPSQYDHPATFTNRLTRQSVTLPPVLAMTSNIQELIYEQVKRGTVIGLLPNYLSSAKPFASNLREVLPDWRLQRMPAQSLYAIHPAGRYQRAATRAVVTHLAMVCAEMR